jgi:hypothetical protein
VPRYVLQNAKDLGQDRLLDEAITGVSVKELEGALLKYGGADKLSARLVHVRVSFSRQGRQALSTMWSCESILPLFASAMCVWCLAAFVCTSPCRLR